MRVVTTDFIVGLPKVKVEGAEFDAIQVMADRHSKMVHLAATDEDRKSTRLNSSHSGESRMPSSA